MKTTSTSEASAADRSLNKRVAGSSSGIPSSTPQSQFIAELREMSTAVSESSYGMYAEALEDDMWLKMILEDCNNTVHSGGPTEAQPQRKSETCVHTPISDDCDSTVTIPAPHRSESPAFTRRRRRRRSDTECRAPKVAFKTKSDRDVIEDGYKWRKYGRKTVKSSPHPRNYYKCSESTCGVKKRVERDPADPGMVITTYEGTHNHESPSIIYYYIG